MQAGVRSEGRQAGGGRPPVGPLGPIRDHAGVALSTPSWPDQKGVDALVVSLLRVGLGGQGDAGSPALASNADRPGVDVGSRALLESLDRRGVELALDSGSLARHRLKRPEVTTFSAARQISARSHRHISVDEYHLLQRAIDVRARDHGYLPAFTVNHD